MSGPASDLPPLGELLTAAVAAGGTKLLLLSDEAPTFRIGRVLQPPLRPKPLSFYDTEHYAGQLLGTKDHQAMLEVGSAEVDFDIDGVTGRATVFFALGCHNIVFHIGESAGQAGP